MSVEIEVHVKVWSELSDHALLRQADVTVRANDEDDPEAYEEAFLNAKNLLHEALNCER